MLLQIQDLVLLPGMDYALRVGRLSEEELSVLHGKNQEVVAVPLKRNRDRYEIKAEAFSKWGLP